MSEKKHLVPPQVQFRSLGQLLRWHRLQLGLSQEALAEVLSVSSRSIQRWEQDQAIPQEVVREHLCQMFGIDSRVLLAVWSGEEASFWHVPLSRNPFFTGREEILHALRERLGRTQRLALTQSWAISGFGGIGKTQIALEYAYRYRQDYTAVFWISAATQESLQAGLLAIAECLKLPEKDDHDHTKVIYAVNQWLATHQGWLLILDNADQVALVRDVLPTQSSGHLLLTTRAQALGSVAQRLEVETMGLAEGTLFLLRRAKLLVPDASLDQASPEHLVAAEAITIEMDFLPLALDQAGAYIEEVGCSLSTYLELYRAHRADLLRRRGQMPDDYPESVGTTWSLNFQQVVHANPAATELLRLCAFLEPDAIPEELFSEGGTVLEPVLKQIAADALALNEAIEELRKFSLVQRDPEARLLRIHRLIQAVLQDAMGKEDRLQWAERAIRATSLIFPDTIEAATWPRCRRFLPQAQMCSVLIQDHAFVFAEAASLLVRTARYLQDFALYEQAEPLYQRAVHIQEQILGLEHPDVARSLNSLAESCKAQGKYEQAEPLLQRAIRIQEQTLGSAHLDVGQSLSALAILYSKQGKYEQAEPVYQQAVRIQEQTLGPEHPAVAYSLNALASLYSERGQYEQAESLYQKTLRIREHTLGPEHPDIAPTVYNLARLYNRQRRYEQAEPLLQRALLIWEQALGPEHPHVAYSLNSLAESCKAQGKYEQAESLYQRALRIWEQALGPEHLNIGYPLTNLAELYSEQGNYEQAEPLYQRALHIWEKALGPEHPDLASLLNGLANLYSNQRMDQQAVLMYQRALSIRERALGEHHLDTAETLHDFAVSQEAQNNPQEAMRLYQRALAIREQVLGTEHATTLATRTKYLALVQAMGQDTTRPGPLGPGYEGTAPLLSWHDG